MREERVNWKNTLVPVADIKLCIASMIMIFAQFAFGKTIAFNLMTSIVQVEQMISR